MKKYKIKFRSFFTFTAILASFFLIYNIFLLGPVEPFIRIFVIILILAIDLYFIRKNNSKRSGKFSIILVIIFAVFNILLGLGISKVYKMVDRLNKTKVTYSTSLIAKADIDFDKMEDVVNLKIGMISDVTSIDNYILANEMIENYDLKEDNEIMQYDDIMDMLHDFYTGEVDLIFISSNYDTMFQSIEEYQNISQEVRVITTSEKTVKKEDTVDYIKSDGKNITEPFTILLMGIDSTVDGLNKSASNGDSLILMSFNPSTLNVTMVSIPRDSYVPISCRNNRESKITHAGWYGTSCMVDTIENFLDVEIDYYLKMNFQGVVSLVNTLGGVEVDVPKDLCTDNSNRVGKVCIKKGLQTLNGEEALVLARNRYDLARGDFDRSDNQQLLIKAMLNKVKEVNSIEQVQNILNTISNNMDTNMTTNQILSLYNIAKDILKVNRNNGDILSIQKLALSGDGQMIYDKSSRLTLWNYILNKQSIKDVSNAINMNLDNNGLLKEFTYSVMESYTSKTIGSGPYKTNNKYVLLPSFLGKNIDEVLSYAKKHNLKIEYNYEEKIGSKYKNGEVFYQNYPQSMRVDQIDVLKVSVLKNNLSSSSGKTDCTSIENTDKVCYLPSLVSKTKDEVKDYFARFENNIKIIYNSISVSLYPGKKIGTVVSQNYKVSTHLSKIDILELTIIEQ